VCKIKTDGNTLCLHVSSRPNFFIYDLQYQLNVDLDRGFGFPQILARLLLWVRFICQNMKSIANNRKSPS